jgi:hypothetical protein
VVKTKGFLAVPMVSLFLLLSLGLVLQVDAVTVRLPREENRLYAAARVATGSEIQLSYRHSVEKTRVAGIFRIGPGPVMQAKETRMTSVGTGLPNTSAARTRREGTWLVVDEGLATVPGFDFFISAVNQTRLTIDGAAVTVEDLSSGSVIHIDTERVRLLDWIMWRYGNKDWQKDGQ